jgi:peptidyl-prolyl cis-trans isomerase-like protein 2
MHAAGRTPEPHAARSFITFRSCKHLDKKHTIFGRVVGGLDTLTEMERVKTEEDDTPLEDIVIEKVTVFVNPFAEVDAQKAVEDKARRAAQAQAQTQAEEKARAEAQAKAAPEPFKAGVGKYMGTQPAAKRQGEAAPDVDAPEPKKKKPASQGFGDFSSW